MIENSHSIMEKVDQLELEIGLIETDELLLNLNRQSFIVIVANAYSDTLTLPSKVEQYRQFFCEQTWLLRESGSGTRLILIFLRTISYCS